MKKPIKLLAAFSIATVLIFSSCHKDEKVEVDNETQSAVDNAVADQEYMAVAPTVQSHAINTKGTGSQNRIMAPCDSLTKISGDTLWGTPGHVNPTYTMNISNTSCAQTMPDGRVRSGYLEITLRGKIKDAGSKMLIKFMGYNASNISYTCDSMVVTTIAASSGINKFNIKLFNGVCKKNTTWTINYRFDRTITFYPHGIAPATDPVTYIYGTSSGTNREGRNFVTEIPESTPLVKFGSCEFISSGLMTLTPDGFATRTVDYGYSISPNAANGCDEDASFTVNGNSIAFKLK